MMTAVCDLFFAPKGIASGGGHGSPPLHLAYQLLTAQLVGVQEPTVLSGQSVFPQGQSSGLALFGACADPA